MANTFKADLEGSGYTSEQVCEANAGRDPGPPVRPALVPIPLETLVESYREWLTDAGSAFTAAFPEFKD